MEDSIMVGDRVMVGKLCYGGLRPRCIADIPLVNVLIFFKSIRETDRERDWGYRRAPALGKVRRGDLVVFNHPNESNVRMVKRCVALPGDTIKLEKGQVLINGSMVNFPTTVKIPESSGTGHIIDFPCRSLGWTENDFGPAVIPAQGMTLALDSANLELYRNMIRLEDHEIISFDTEIYIDGVAVSDYTFKTDGFFVLGDNRIHSIDSRYFGVVPEQLIIGKAKFVYFSADTEKKQIRWKRIGNFLK